MSLQLPRRSRCPEASTVSAALAIALLCPILFFSKLTHTAARSLFLKSPSPVAPPQRHCVRSIRFKGTT